MKTWLMLLMVVVIVAGIILGLAFLSSLAILSASKRYLKKQRQQDTQWILGMLPGKNCADCGQDNCRAYAQQTAENHGFCSDCPWLDPAVREQIEAEFTKRQAVLQERQEKQRAK